ncbi:MAG: WYL domain-containing protein [Actinomycetota bacterium]|jgi:proteasome accessory factor C|nr:WYL domain-containing protein [Actinomycetota bacterium]
MAKTPASERARRLLAVIARLESGSEIPLVDLAAELDASPTELASDLETLSLCGVAPFTPDEMIDVFVVDGMVEVYSPLPALDRPVRLSMTEARALAAALQGAGFSADDSLVQRLEAATAREFDAAQAERIVRAASGQHAKGVYGSLAAAAGAHRVVTIDYESAGGAGTSREIEPHVLFAERGAWYVAAHCRLAGAERTFRVDRIRSAQENGESFTVDAADAAPRTATPSGDLPTARVRFDAAGDFSARDWPGARLVSEHPAESGDGDIAGPKAVLGPLEIEIPYAGTDWIARRVVARGGAVEVLSPPDVRAAVVAVAESYSG